MRITRDFIYGPHEDLDVNGLKPVWFENADPANGRGVAHDMLEHFAHQVGPVEGECEAIGAFLAIRVETGAMPQLQANADMASMRNSLGSVLLDLARESLPVPAPKRSCRLADEFDYADGMIQGSVAQAFDFLRRELELQPHECANHYLLGDKTLPRTIKAWVRSGYRKAQQRYRYCDLHTLGNSFFPKLAKRVDQLLSADNLVSGDVVRISLDPENYRMAFKVNGHCAEDYGYF